MHTVCFVVSGDVFERARKCSFDFDILLIDIQSILHVMVAYPNQLLLILPFDQESWYIVVSFQRRTLL